MNSEDLQVQYKVIGISGAPRNTHTLGTYECIRDAQERVKSWRGDADFKYTAFDEVKIVKHSQVTVQTTVERKQHAPDYERQGVQTQTADFLELQDTVRHLEDRHVGLRHELLSEIEDLQDDIEELREEEVRASAEINNLDEAMRDEVAGLRREVEDLREHLQQIAPVLYVTAKDEQWKS